VAPVAPVAPVETGCSRARVAPVSPVAPVAPIAPVSRFVSSCDGGDDDAWSRSAMRQRPGAMLDQQQARPSEPASWRKPASPSRREGSCGKIEKGRFIYSVLLGYRRPLMDRVFAT